jgi:hypothetical protein
MSRFLKSAIKHPGRMKQGAAHAGMGLHEYMEKESHSSNPSLRAAANLGLRSQKGGDLHKHHVPRRKS